ncbi:MAG: DUF167 domain-containing protein [bacterium]
MGTAARKSGGGQGPPFYFWVRVKARSREDGISGLREDGALEVRVRALPVRGDANESCLRLLARSFGLPVSRFHIDRGAASPRKRIRVEGLTPDEGASRLGALGRTSRA